MLVVCTSVLLWRGERRGPLHLQGVRTQDRVVLRGGRLSSTTVTYPGSCGSHMYCSDGRIEYNEYEYIGNLNRK